MQQHQEHRQVLCFINALCMSCFLFGYGAGVAAASAQHHTGQTLQRHPAWLPPCPPFRLRRMDGHPGCCRFVGIPSRKAQKSCSLGGNKILSSSSTQQRDGGIGAKEMEEAQTGGGGSWMHLVSPHWLAAVTLCKICLHHTCGGGGGGETTGKWQTGAIFCR